MNKHFLQPTSFRLCTVIGFLVLVSGVASAASGTLPSREAVDNWCTQVSRAWLRKLGKTPADLKTVKADTVSVPMRDGTLLATTVYQPIGLLYPPPNATVLVRTPYGRGGLEQIAQALTLAGFACVCQDARGTGDSGGECRVFFDDGWGLDETGEHWDGYDTVEWVAAQSWSEDKVGMFGFSALGIAANLAAGALPPHLECTAVYVAASDIYQDAAHQGGGFRAALVEGWLSGVNAHPDVLATTIARENYGPEWQDASVVGRHPLINTPTYHLGGWYDIFLQGTINHFTGLQANGDGLARGNQKLIIGPWTHSGQAGTQQGELNYPSNSVVNDDELFYAIDWFDYWLKDGDPDAYNLPAVRYYVMGAAGESGAPGNEWREAETWPPSATPVQLYLAPTGELVGQPPDLPVSSREFVYDPHNPAPTVGGSNLELPAGPYDQRSVEARPDVLVYTTEPLTEPLEFVGAVDCHLTCQSTTVDTDWTVKLCDVYPDGRSMLIADGITRARYRNSLETAEAVTPGEVHSVTVSLWSTAMVINTGHRLRISVSSSNATRFDPNPNTGEPLRQNTFTQTATNTVHCGGTHLSWLELPVTAPAQHPLTQTEASRNISVLRLH